MKPYILQVDGEDAEMVARLGAAVCLQWTALSQQDKGLLLEQAGLVEVPGSMPVQLRQLVEAFVKSKKVAHA